MKLLIVNKYGQSEVKNTDILPRIGDSVDMFYRPFPVVQNVVLHPKPDTMQGFDHVDAIITVD